MDFLYALVKNCGTYQPDQDPLRLLQNYFQTEGAFTDTFIIALVVAIIGLVVFYGIFGMKVYKLATPAVYWTTLALVGLFTLCSTQIVIVGSKSAQTGFFQSSKNNFEVIVAELPEDDAEEALEQREDLEKKMSGLCAAVLWLDGCNAVYGMAIFFLLSIGVKGKTTHAKSIPF